jgi:hypothetical protein
MPGNILVAAGIGEVASSDLTETFAVETAGFAVETPDFGAVAETETGAPGFAETETGAPSLAETETGAPGFAETDTGAPGFAETEAAGAGALFKLIVACGTGFEAAGSEILAV